MVPVGLTGCQTRAAESKPDAVPVVRAAKIEPAPWAQPPLTGTVVAQTQSAVAFQTGGRIAVRKVERGQHVAAGETLYRLDDHDLKLKLAAAQARLQQTDAEARFAHENFKRIRQLLARKVVGQQDYDQAQSAMNAAESSRQAARADVDQARRMLGYARLVAPFAGTVVEIDADQGDVVAAGQRVLTLAADGPRLALVNAPEQRLAELPKRADARLSGSDRDLAATLYSVAGAADPVTRTWAVRFRLAASKAAATPSSWSTPMLGRTVTLSFPDQRARRTVPIAALSATDEHAFVFVVAQGKVHRHPVQVLKLDNERAVIVTDLPLGTQVVAVGLNRLHDGEVVRLQPASETAG